MANAHLPRHHYAAKWVADKELKTPEEVTDLGLLYVSLPEGPEKEKVLLELLQCFHGYTSKYLSMILRGHVPYYGGQVNKDAKIFLHRFLPRGSTINKQTLLNACRHLHLAFKGCEAGEVYDVLVVCLLRAIQKWDPKYSEKVQEVIAVIDTKLKHLPQFTAYQLNSQLQFNGSSIARMLVSRGFLAKVPGEKPGEPGQFQLCADAWPPPTTLYGGVVGLTYFVSSWFRYYLQQYITSQMSQLESTEDILQLEHRHTRAHNEKGSPQNSEMGIPTSGGHFSSCTGQWLADVCLMEQEMDLVQLNLAWVESTTNPLFASLTVQERYLFYLVYARELTWKDVASTLGLPLKQVKTMYVTVLDRLRVLSGAQPGATS